MRISPRVLVTRAAEDAAALSHALHEAGLEPVVVPALERLFCIDEMVALADRAGHADLLVVTSPAVADVLGLATPDSWRKCDVAAVGQATRRRLEDLGWPVHYIPERATGEDLVALLDDIGGLRVAWPRADLADPATADRLRSRGAEVFECIAYRNVEPAGLSERLANALPVDCTTLMSGSAARRVADQVPVDERWRLGRVAVIGPSTKKVCEQVGLTVHATASPHSVAGLVQAVAGLFPDT